MAWQFCLTNTCFALLPTVYSSMVPGNLPSQLEILSTGQTYYQTVRSFVEEDEVCLFLGFKPGDWTQYNRPYKVVLHVQLLCNWFPQDPLTILILFITEQSKSDLARTCVPFLAAYGVHLPHPYMYRPVHSCCRSGYSQNVQPSLPCFISCNST